MTPEFPSFNWKASPSSRISFGSARSDCSQHGMQFGHDMSLSSGICMQWMYVSNCICICIYLSLLHTITKNIIYGIEYILMHAHTRTDVIHHTHTFIYTYIYTYWHIIHTSVCVCVCKYIDVHVRPGSLSLGCGPRLGNSTVGSWKFFTEGSCNSLVIPSGIARSCSKEGFFPFEETGEMMPTWTLLLDYAR